MKKKTRGLAVRLTVLSLLVAAVAVAAVVASAASAKRDAGPVELNYWDMQWGGPAFQNAIRANVNAFNKTHPKIHVKFTQLSWGDYTQKILSAVQAGSPPDMSGG